MPKLCENCGNKLDLRRSTAIYCSNRCKARAYRKRKKLVACPDEDDNTVGFPGEDEEDEMDDPLSI